MTSEVDLDNDDFQRSPWLYPGTPPPGDGLLRGSEFLALAPNEQRRLGQAQVDSRHVVVAVGSNASPAVIRRKFRLGRVSTTVPFVRATVKGLAIGHSAHVSAAGYIAAAPYRDPDTTSDVMVSLLTDSQLECLDGSEPNYFRSQIRSSACQLTLAGGERPEAFVVYVSRWGILARDDGMRLSFVDQEALFAELRASCSPFADLVEGGDYKAVMARLAHDERLREQVSGAFLQAGWVAPHGFETADRAVSVR